MAAGPFEILVVILLILVLFGSSRLPGIAENLAKGIKSFKQGLNDKDLEEPKKITKHNDEKGA